MSLTEKRNPASRGIDELPTLEILRILQGEDASVPGVVRKQLPLIAEAVEAACAAVRAGGKVFYAGAGTSGRLGVLDAAEIPPTFGLGCFRAVIAGGRRAVTKAVEGAEDDERAGRAAASRLTGRDMAMGISSSGTTPFVVSFLKAAKARGARCWLVTCNEGLHYPFLDGTVPLVTGPEIIAGSTRLKAATATKLALNMFSTATMIRLGRVHDGLMVDLVPSNRKLVKRAEGIIMEITGCSKEEAARYLKRSGMRPKVAAVMLRKGVSRRKAEEILEDAGGFLRKALR
jgi:N-acetylmuramic acid 6-phosphate etherase